MNRRANWLPVWLLVGVLFVVGCVAEDIQVFSDSMTTEQVMGPDGFPEDRLLYGVNQNLTITLRQAADTGRVANTIRATIGAPYLYGLSLSPDLSPEHRAQLWTEAHNRAIADAATKAQQLAHSLGLTLGPPVSATVLAEPGMTTPTNQTQVTVQISYEVR